MELRLLIGFGVPSLYSHKRRKGRVPELIWPDASENRESRVSKSANIWGFSAALVVYDSTVVCRTGEYDPNSGLQSWPPEAKGGWPAE